MRPRSAGSSLISKLLLPLFTLAAISIATPPRGTAPPVAGVAVKLLAGARFDAELICGAAPSACADGSAISAATCTTLAVGVAWSRAEAAGATVAASATVFWTAGFAVSGLPVVDVCAVAVLRAESVVTLVAFVSADTGWAANPLVAACAFPCVVLGTTGVVTATAVVKAEGSAGGELPAGTPGDAVVDVLPGSDLPGTAGPGGGERGCELAAIAAAAIARGAVGPPELGGAEGVFVTGVDVGTGAATGVGVVRALPTCCARMVASAAVASASAGSPLDVWSPGFDVPEVVAEVVVVDWLVPLAAAPLLLAFADALALDADPSLLAALSELLPAGAELGELLLFAGAALLLALWAGGLLSD